MLNYTVLFKVTAGTKKMHKTVRDISMLALNVPLYLSLQKLALTTNYYNLHN